MSDIILFDDDTMLFEESDATTQELVVTSDTLRQSSEEFKDIFQGISTEITFSSYAMLIFQHLSRLSIDVDINVFDAGAIVEACTKEIEKQNILLDRIESLLEEMTHFDRRYTKDAFSVHRISTSTLQDTFKVLIHLKAF